MHGLPDVRKPAAGKAAGFLKNTDLAIQDSPDISETKTQRQACRILDRFAVSMSTARVIADLAYGGRAV